MALTREQFEKSYRELEDLLFNFAYRWVFNSSLAEELVHDAFIRIWNKRDEVEVATLKSLLYKTVQNLALNEIRKRKLRDSFKEVLSWMGQKEQSADTMMAEENNLKNLQRALDALPLESRQVLLLSEFSDMSYSEIAVSMDIAEGTVASRKNRALKQLRENFQKLEDSQNER